jgi:hypothetical protein
MYYNATTKEITALSSSRETKHSIKDLVTDTSKIYGLQPKTYIYNSDPGSGEDIGYIAEEVKELHRYFASYNTPDLVTPVAINYNVIVVFLVEEIKKLKASISSGKGKIENNISTTITLPPSTYEFTIQITPIYNGETPSLYSVSEVINNQFTVYGPNGSFFWSVHGNTPL